MLIIFKSIFSMAQIRPGFIEFARFNTGSFLTYFANFYRRLYTPRCFFCAGTFFYARIPLSCRYGQGLEIDYVEYIHQ